MTVFFMRQPRYINRGRDKRFRVDRFGNKVYRTEQDIYNENVVKSKIEKYTGHRLEIVGNKFCKIDWQVFSGNQVVGFVESKVKNFAENKLKDYFASKSKVDALLDASFIWRVPAIFAWGFVDPKMKNDAIRYLRVDSFDFTSVPLEIDGCRELIKSKYDRELMYKIPPSATTKLC